uniref:YprB ribonuclease H-like domain-containing protein n=1 Tax=uncultured bacterium contig00019 TaxID=1181510 RepID=A0A806KQ30_9BACT|nr:hypothetical protein [uncultured bacterium contig00019]
MANLRDRLRRIQDAQKQYGTAARAKKCEDFELPGWAECGCQAKKREMLLDAPIGLPSALPPAIAVIAGDFDRIAKTGRGLPAPEDLLFFDLETTGLSTASGTVSFLAAFGQFIRRGGGLKLRITQYLLLDFPGEEDFLRAVLGEFKNSSTVVVTYNGKCFDSQILASRCVQKRIKPPEYFHADLLHPARRLWKGIASDCSQSTIETEILGLDRTGDIPGALAPEIWFDFLKTGETRRLLGICDHNCADISGLAAMLCAFCEIADSPFETNYNYSRERLALYWRDYARRAVPSEELAKLKETGVMLLLKAANSGCPCASLAYALDQMRAGSHEDGRKRLLGIAEAEFPSNLKAAALRALSIDSERRLKNADEALGFANIGLGIKEAGNYWQKDFCRRAERLQKKPGLRR